MITYGLGLAKPPREVLWCWEQVWWLSRLVDRVPSMSRLKASQVRRYSANTPSGPKQWSRYVLYGFFHVHPLAESRPLVYFASRNCDVC